jgi:hypothetical protein
MALQSVIGGMTLSVIGMLRVAAGAVPIVAGAVTQVGMDVAAVAKTWCVTIRPRTLADDG